MSNISAASGYSIGAGSGGGIPGLASGMDTEALVEKMLAGTQKKLDKQYASRQVAEWKQNMYRDVVKKMNTFHSKYFDFLSDKGTTLTSKSFFNQMMATASSAAFKVSGSANANAGNTSVIVKQLASRSRYEGAQLEGTNAISDTFDEKQFNKRVVFEIAGLPPVVDASGTEVNAKVDPSNIVLSSADIDKIMSGGTVEFKVPGSTPDGEPEVKDTITFSMKDGILTVDAGKRVASVTTEKVQNAITSDPTAAKVKATGTALGLETLGLYKDSKTVPGILGEGKIGYGIISKVNADAKPTLKFSLDGIEKEIAIEKGMTYEDLQASLDKAFGTGSVIVKNKAGDDPSTGSLKDFVISTKDPHRELVIGGNNSGLAAMGGIQAGKSNIVATGDTLGNVFGQEFFTDEFKGEDGNPVLDADGNKVKTVTFKINNKDITVKNTDTIDSFMKQINKSDAGVEIKYQSYENKFVVSSKDSGAGFDISYTSSTFLDKVFGGSGKAKKLDGQNAIISINGVQTERSTNEFTIDGLSYTLTGESAKSGKVDDPLTEVDESYISDTVTTTRNTEAIFDGIKAFVNDYNTLIKELNDLTGAKSTYKDYPPLTETQKKDMTKGEIDAWEKKGQEGLLKSDSEVGTLLSEMRLALYQKPEGSELSLFSLGIETGTDWKDNGKLIIDESKLKEMINSNPEDIQELFTFKETKPEYNDSKKTWETVDVGVQGIATAFNNIIKRAANTSSGSKGTLVEIAGAEGTASDKKNNISDQMTKMTERIETLKRQYEREKARYWAQFNNMEKVIGNLSAQSGWLTQQFSG